MNRGLFETAGRYDIPLIKREECPVCEWIGFNEAKSVRDRKGKGIHFFLDDYQFTRLWNRTDSYFPMLLDYECVMSPDFSLYTDFPLSLQIYNHYRKHWLGACLQENGIHVIPTVCWSSRESFEWCFDGEPVGGTVAVSSVGCCRDRQVKKLFLEGYHEMLLRLEPEKILFYGQVPDECTGNILTVDAFQTKFASQNHKKKNARPGG